MAELLSSLQKITLAEFARSPLKKFYWTGGTALAAVYLQHRYSQDLDFYTQDLFTHQEVFMFVHNLKKAAKLSRIEEKHIYDRWEFFVHNENSVRLEFVRYAFQHLKKPKSWQGITVDSLDDIAANKTMALLERNEPKDVFDLYFLLKKGGYGVSKLLRMVERKFGVRYDAGLFWSEAHKSLKDLRALTPMVAAKTTSQKKQLLRKIENFVGDHSSRYLRARFR